MKPSAKKGVLIGVIIVSTVVLGAVVVLMTYSVKFVFKTIPSISLMIDSIKSIVLAEPEKPMFEYGEFPFKLVCEMDGEKIVIEDTLVIEYKGVEWNESAGKHNKWERYLKSQQVKGYIRQNVVLFDGLLENGDSATIYLELGSCEYYMGLEDERYYYSDIKPGDIVILTHQYTGSISAEELFDNYHINFKIIELELSSPLKKTEAGSMS